MNGEVLELGGMNINEFGIKFKDLGGRELIQEIINAITLNNSAIGSRINDLHNRLSNVELNYVIKSLIGNIPNKVDAQEAVYYTQEEADAYNTEHNLKAGDEEYKTTSDIKIPATEAIPYSSIIEILEENEHISAAALNDLNDQINNIIATTGNQGSNGTAGLVTSVVALTANVSSSCSITGSGNSGKIQTIIYTNNSGSVKIVTVPTTYKTPTGSAIELSVPNGGYCEVNYLNINGTIYARGL